MVTTALNSPTSATTAVASTARLFLGLPLPLHVHAALVQGLAHFSSHIDRAVPKSSWHITLLWLGEVARKADYQTTLLDPLPQEYVPAVRLTHVGRGQRREQLWAYAEASTLLQSLRQQLLDRLGLLKLQVPATETDFVPHVRLANVKKETPTLADYSLPVTFRFDELVLYQSESHSRGRSYKNIGSISLI